MLASNGAAPSGLPAAPHAVVVGAGPAGALMALHLAEQGFRVSVWEKRLPEQAVLSEPQGAASQQTGTAAAAAAAEAPKAPTIGSRSYALVLSERALLALDGAGVTLPPDLAPRYHTAITHSLAGSACQGSTRQRTGRDVLVNRGLLAGQLVQVCKERYPEAVKFHFGYRITGLDTSARTAQFSTAEGDQVEAAYDLLVGADGANSGTRALLQQQDPDFKVEQRLSSDDYKSFSLGPAHSFTPNSVGEAKGTVHVWSDRKAKASIIGGVAADGLLLAVLILPRGVYEMLGGAAGHEAFLRQHFHCIPPDTAQHAARQLAEAAPSVDGISTRCATLCSGRVVLVGDSGHSVWPTLAHGANSALESAALLAAALKAAGGAVAVASGRLEEALEEYSRQRLPDAHAVVQLSEEGFTAPFMFPRMLAQMALHKALPWLVPSPAFFQLHGTALPYSILQRCMQREVTAFKAAGLVLGATALAWAARRAMVPALVTTMPA